MRLSALLCAALLVLPASVSAQAGTGWRITIGGQNVFVGSVARPNTATGTALGATGFRWDVYGRTLDLAGSGDGSGVARFGTMSGTSTDSNLFNVTGTLPAVSTIAQVGVRILVTGAGSSAVAQRAFQTNFEPGYTGGAATMSARFSSDTAGTGQSAWNAGAANYGSYSAMEGVTTGHNVASACYSRGSSVLNIGCAGLAVINTNTPAINGGIVGLGLNATVNFGGFFGLRSTAPTLAASFALGADNGALAVDILSLRDNDVVVARVVNGGTLALIGSLIPAVSNTGANTCGTDAAVMDAGSNENAGSFVVGATAGTDCTLTFTTVAPNRWHCVSNNETTANLSRAVYVDTTHVKIQGTFVAGDRVSYLCVPR